MRGGVIVVRLFADLLVGLGQDLEVKPMRFGDPYGNENLQGVGNLAG